MEPQAGVAGVLRDEAQPAPALHAPPPGRDTAARVVRVLEQVIALRGAPERLRLDNGPEFTGGLFHCWAAEQGIAIQHIEPGKPSQNGFIERFNGSYRTEVLDAWIFNSLDAVREETQRWVDEYNLNRPHESLGDIPPIEFLNQRGHAEFSIYPWP
jgi:putative transposase